MEAQISHCNVFVDDVQKEVINLKLPCTWTEVKEALTEEYGKMVSFKMIDSNDITLIPGRNLECIDYVCRCRLEPLGTIITPIPSRTLYLSYCFQLYIYTHACYILLYTFFIH